MSRVLIATDGSDTAIEAARHAVDLLGPGQEYTAVFVVPPPSHVYPAGGFGIGVEPLGGPSVAPAVEEEQLEAVQDESREALDRTVRALGVDAETVTAEGDPGKEICRLAGAGGFDLVVVGSHGTGLVRRVLVGSVSHYVVHHATCPVLVVRAPE
jgi:nucleotide-binding universal stress UspA family protein